MIMKNRMPMKMMTMRIIIMMMMIMMRMRMINRWRMSDPSMVQSL